MLKSVLPFKQNMHYVLENANYFSPPCKIFQFAVVPISVFVDHFACTVRRPCRTWSPEYREDKVGDHVVLAFITPTMKLMYVVTQTAVEVDAWIAATAIQPFEYKPLPVPNIAHI